MSSSLAPWRLNVSMAPASRLSTTKLFQRVTAMQKRALLATRAPSMVFMVMLYLSEPRLRHTLLCIDELDDFEIKTGQRV